MPLPMTIARFMSLVLLLPMALGMAQPLEASTTAAPSQVYSHKKYAGKIADKYPFTMDLKNVDGVLTGTYRYTGKTVDIALRGNIDLSGLFTMDEYNAFQRIAVFKGTVAGQKISGLWQSVDGSKKLSFAADETSEIRIGSKGEILTKAIGEYALESISGAGGANGMWDTWKTKAKWGSNSSSISNGMRGTNNIKLTAAGIRVLNGIKITVTSDLATHFLAGGKTVVTIPYRGNGMAFDIKTAPNSVVADELKKFSSSTTVLDERLYLLVQDNVDYSAAISGNFEATVSDIVVVSYSILEDNFEVRFVDSQCCGGTSFAFKRRGR